MSEEERISVRCACGKAYRVGAAKAGKKITCKACGAKVKVPGERALSKSSRGFILAEFGIDAAAAEQRYEEETRRETADKVYRCSRCQKRLDAAELKGAYVSGELVCPECRAAAEVSDRKAEREAEEKGQRAAVEAVSAREDPARARAIALAYGGLFLVGVAGPVYTLTSLGLVASLAIGLAVAAAGARQVYRLRT